MKDYSINNLKILNKISKDLYITKKSSLSRINNEQLLDKNTRDFLYTDIIDNLDDDLFLLKDKIINILRVIPVYKNFLKRIECLSVYDCADLITQIGDIDNFPQFKNLLSYSGYTPKRRRYNKDLNKTLIKISYKLSEDDLGYNFIYETAVEQYKESNPNKTDIHIENMARRIVIKKFLKNLYVNWGNFNEEESFFEDEGFL